MTESSSSRFEFRSDLAATPLPEVLLTIHKYRVPGVIECAREGASKSIYIDQGNIIFASSNQTEDSLGDRLLEDGRITREQYDESVRRLKAGGNTKRQGTILVEMGALAPKDLFVSVREQVQQIVWSIFDWESGSVLFSPGRDRHTEFIKLSIPTPQAVLQGVRTMLDAKRLVARLGTKSTVLDRVPGKDASELLLDAEENALLEAVDGKKALVELIATPGMPPPQNAKMLYAFSIFGLVQVRSVKPMKVQFRTSGEKYRA